MTQPTTDKSRVVGPWCYPGEYWERTGCLCACHFHAIGDAPAPCNDKHCAERLKDLTPDE
jgi:hypothetical protein